MALATQCRVRNIRGKFERFTEPIATSYAYPKKQHNCKLPTSPTNETSTYRQNGFIHSDNFNNNIPSHPNPHDKSNVSSSSFSTFAEKQKLVENIVLNIKNREKTQPLEERKPKNGLSNLFDRDMKDVLERSVRRFSIGRKENVNVADKYENRTKAFTLEQKDQVSSPKIRKSKNVSGKVTPFTKEEPQPPPRKRLSKKKPKAPEPPIDEPVLVDDIYHPDKTPPQILSKFPVSTRIKNLSSSDEDPFPSYRRDPFNMEPTDKNTPLHYKNNIPGAYQDGSLPNGPPPQKPPRTFAHDIYRQAKALEVERKPVDPQIEALYSKPIKKSKQRDADSREKSVSFADPGIAKGLGPKPQVAPKPSHLNSKKRFSVIEPMESTTPEFLETKPSMKRNSSFRFSFRKSKRPSPSPTRLSQVSKLRQIARSWTKLKAPEETHSEKQNSRSRSEEQLYKCPSSRKEEPIYDSPYEEKCIHQEELHYMVSPLFGTQEYNKPLNPENDNDKSRKWGNMKNEFRQSCRNIQKKLKSVT